MPPHEGEPEAEEQGSENPVLECVAALRHLKSQSEDNNADSVLKSLAAMTTHADSRSEAIQADAASPLTELLQRDWAQYNDSTAQKISNRLALVIRILRNLCVGSQVTQDTLVAGGTLQLVVQITLDLVVEERVVLSYFKKDCACMGLQLIGNIMAANAANTTAVWGLLYPDGFTTLIEAAIPDADSVRNPSLLACTAMLLQTCLAKDGDELLRRLALVQDPPGIQIFKRLLEYVAQIDVPGQQALGTFQLEARHWVTIIAHGQCKAGLLVPMYNSLGCASSSFIDLPSVQLPVMDACQAQVLNLLTDIVEQVGDSDHGWLKTANTNLCKLFLSEDAFPSTTQLGSLLSDEVISAAVETVFVAVHILGQVSKIDGLSLDDASRVQVSIQALRVLKAAGPPPQPPATSVPAAEQRLPRGFKSKVVQLIGNAVYRHQASQIAVLDAGGVAEMMAHTNTDDSNPYIREVGLPCTNLYCQQNCLGLATTLHIPPSILTRVGVLHQWSILCLRNLCEGNAAVQVRIMPLCVSLLPYDTISDVLPGIHRGIRSQGWPKILRG
jgi:hypothetical protein